MDKKKILAIDDSPVNLSTIEQALQDEYDVIPMAAAPRALKYLDKHQADLILLDVQMPVMNGIEALQKLREMENGASVPVIFLSAARDDNAAAEGERLGISDYILKPFHKEDLKSRINAAILRS